MEQSLLDYLHHRITRMETEIEKLQLQNELLTAKLQIAQHENQNG